MIGWFLSRWIGRFERAWGYDASYLRDILDADARALMAFGKVTGIGAYRKDVPLAVYSAAGIVAVMSKDCGPCTSGSISPSAKSAVNR
jgi:hypothetical protein